VIADAIDRQKEQRQKNFLAQFWDGKNNPQFFKHVFNVPRTRKTIGPDWLSIPKTKADGTLATSASGIRGI
jgi:hypothetical protein